MRDLPALLIAKKRDGEALSAEEIDDLVGGIVDGTLADAQLGALLMAGLLRGSTNDEVVAWTRAMRDSGYVLDRSDAAIGPSLDKHSTGGVGDKVSLVLAPLVAACGARVPMISGRGLGHTGGTIDKLESIPGLRVGLEIDEFERNIESVGFAMAQAGDWLAPADRRAYSIRDVTGTVECVPWITASILSKKLAEGLDGLVLDVKCGRGAFMKTRERARELADSLVRVASALGCRTRALLTDMDRPLGRAIGNSLEVAESLECLAGVGPEDLRELTIELAAEMLELGGVVDDVDVGRARATQALDDGTALERFRRFVEVQGGDPRVVDQPREVLPTARCTAPVVADVEGHVGALDPMQLALGALRLGAGRRTPGEPIDHAVGIQIERQVGDAVSSGDTLAVVHAQDSAEATRLAGTLGAAWLIAPQAASRGPLVLERIDSH